MTIVKMLKKYQKIILRGCDGVLYNSKTNNYYIYIEHFRNEKNRVEDIKYCPMCGVKLK